MSRGVLETDVLIMGGGLAGLAAAIAAAEAGVRVLVVRRGLGTTAMCSGGLDFPARLPTVHGVWLEASGVQETGGGAWAELSRWLPGFAGRPGEDMPLLDTSGELRRTDIASLSIAAGRLDRWPAGAAHSSPSRVLFLGVEGHGAFRPDWVVRRVVAAGLADRAAVAAATIAVPGLGGRADLDAVRVARALENRETAERFGAAAGRAARKAGAALIALPPVLGLERADRVYRWVAESAGAAAPDEPATVARGGAEAGAPASGLILFELLSKPPSLPGLRLQAALDEAAREAGALILSGRAVPGEPALAAAPPGASPCRLTSVRVEAGEGVLDITAREFVLATGKFIAGGLSLDGQALREPVFDLCVFAPPPAGWPPGALPAGRRQVTEMVWSRFRARHPVFEAGLFVDGALRPFGRRQAIAYENLRVAGSILGGYNPLTDGAGAGVAIASGIAAGRLAAKGAAGS